MPTNVNLQKYFLPEVTQTLLSAASLGYDEEHGSESSEMGKRKLSTIVKIQLKQEPKDPNRLRKYTHNGVKIVCMYWGPRSQTTKKYGEYVIRAPLGWFPSRTANFVFGVDIDPDILFRYVPVGWNPSLWYRRSEKRELVLRVPRNWKNEVTCFLSKKFWLDTKTNRWYLWKSWKRYDRKRRTEQVQTGHRQIQRELRRISRHWQNVKRSFVLESHG